MFHVRGFGEFGLLWNGYTGYIIKKGDEVLLTMCDTTDEAVKAFEELIVLQELGEATPLNLLIAFPFLRATYRNSMAANSAQPKFRRGKLAVPIEWPF